MRHEDRGPPDSSLARCAKGGLFLTDACLSSPTSRGLPPRARARASSAGRSSASTREPVRAADRGAAVAAAVGKRVRRVRRVGKRIVLALDGDLFIVVHLMIAGPPPLARRRARSCRQHRARGVRLPERHARRSPRRERSARVAACRRGARRRSPRSTRAASSRSTRDLAEFRARSRARTTRSSERSPIRACSAASATRTPTRSCIARSCRRSSSREARRRARSPALRRDARGARRVDRAPARRRPATRSREGHRVPRRDGRARPVSASRARCAARRCSASCTPRTRRTTARAARPRAACSPIARCRACCTRLAAQHRRRVGAAPVVRNGEPHVRDELLATVDSTHEDQLQRILRRQRPQAVGFFLADPAADQRGVALVDGGGPGHVGRPRREDGGQYDDHEPPRSLRSLPPLGSKRSTTQNTTRLSRA